MFFCGLIIGITIYFLGLISIYLSAIFIIFDTLNLIRKNIKNNIIEIIENYKKDNILGKEVLFYQYIEHLFLIGFLIPMYLAPTETQIISSVYIICYFFISIKEFINIKKYLKVNNFIY